MSKNKSFNEEKIIAVLREYNEGKTKVKDIASNHGVTAMNVSQWVKAAGLKRRVVKPMYDWDKIKKEIGA